MTQLFLSLQAQISGEILTKSAKPETPLLSPPKNLMESAHRRSISKSTCSIEKVAPKPNINGWKKEEEGEEDFSLNGFLKEEKTKIEKILNRELPIILNLFFSSSSFLILFPLLGNENSYRSYPLCA